jgi:hypothetical protein
MSVPVLWRFLLSIAQDHTDSCVLYSWSVFAGHDQAKIHLPTGWLLYIVTVRKLIGTL